MRLPLSARTGRTWAWPTCTRALIVMGTSFCTCRPAPSVTLVPLEVYWRDIITARFDFNRDGRLSRGHQAGPFLHTAGWPRGPCADITHAVDPPRGACMMLCCCTVVMRSMAADHRPTPRRVQDCVFEGHCFAVLPDTGGGHAVHGWLRQPHDRRGGCLCRKNE